MGMPPTVTSVDPSQYKERTNAYQFDMAWYTRALSLSPGNGPVALLGRQGGDRTGIAQLDGDELARS